MPDIDPNEEGRATPPPPLPPEVHRLGIKRDAVGTMQLPKEHWSAGMQPGEVKVRDGVVLGHVPKRQARVFVAGLRDGEQPAFEIAAIEDGLPDAPKRSSDQHLNFAPCLAGYFGKH